MKKVEKLIIAIKTREHNIDMYIDQINKEAVEQTCPRST